MIIKIWFWCNISNKEYYSAVNTVQAYNIFYSSLHTLYSSIQKDELSLKMCSISLSLDTSDTLRMHGPKDYTYPTGYIKTAFYLSNLEISKKVIFSSALWKIMSYMVI